MALDSTVVIASIGSGAVASPVAAWLGLRRLDELEMFWPLAVAAALGAAAGAAAAVAVGSSSDLALAAMLIWAVGLAACSACDATSRRVPTSVVRQSGVLVAVLLVGRAAVDQEWRPVVIAAIACVVSFSLALAGWRYAELGRGDSRLAALGGLGLGWTSIHAVVLGLAALCIVSLVGVGVVLARGGDRHTMIPFGVPIAVGFLVAAATA